MMAHEVRARLVTLGLTTGYSVFVNTLPDQPDLAIALNEGGGVGPEFVFGQTAISVERPSLQVLVRGVADEHDIPRLAIERIYQAAGAWGAFTHSGGARYLSFTPLQAPFPFRTDDRKRKVFAVNFLVDKEPSPTT